jgi:hypothetical protein
MSKIDELASQLTNDPLIDELTDLLYEAAIATADEPGCAARRHRACGYYHGTFLQEEPSCAVETS